MKKVLLFIVATMFVGSVSAQDWQKNIFGVRAGVNFSTMGMTGFESVGYRTSFNAGLSYERMLLKNNPLYLETGLLYSDKGYNSVDGDETVKLSMSYFQIPLMINYKFKIGESFTIYPSAGLYYAFAVAGKEQYIEEVVTQYDKYNKVWEYNPFDEDEAEYLMKRSDFGYRFSVSCAWKRVVLSAGYEGSIIGVAKDSVIKVKGSNIFVSVGYNF